MLIDKIFKIFNVSFKIWIVVVVSLAFDNPRLIGHWKAEVDIAYDSIWAEYIEDCDCVPQYVD